MKHDPELDWYLILLAALIIALLVLVRLEAGGVAHAQDTTDRERARLVGPVRRVRVEDHPVRLEQNRPAEGPGWFIEESTYDENGLRLATVVNSSFYREDTAGTIEKNDDHGNVYERIYYDAKGQVRRRELFTYQYDSWGNWTLRQHTLITRANNQNVLEPLRNTRRTITYFADAPTATTQPSSPQQGATKAPDEEVGLVAVNTPSGTPATAQAHSSTPLLQRNVAGRAIHLPRPTYPNHLRLRGISGQVVVEVKIDAQGKVTGARAVSGPRELYEVALEVARQARFEPTLVAGQPVATVGHVTYSFYDPTAKPK